MDSPALRDHPSISSANEVTLAGVCVRPLAETGGLVHLAQPRGAPPRLASWLAAQAPALEAMGAMKALLLRGFGVCDREAFAGLVSEVLHPMPYLYRSTPRTSVGARVYTATEYPATRTIPLHCENAYQRTWPSHLMFHCERPAPQGGQTPLASVAAITAAIPASIKDEFRRKKIRYVRNYRAGLDLSWQTVFQTEDRAALEGYCRAHGISWAWSGAGDLRTEQICDATVEHPRTGDRLWFNQAHLFHVSSLDEATRAALLSLYRPDELPRYVTYGDGSAIEPDTIEQIRGAFEAHARAFEWEAGDTLWIDNLLVAHGRRPYAGSRTVLVSMGRRREASSAKGTP